jgi:hypothetical protein
MYAITVLVDGIDIEARQHLVAIGIGLDWVESR